MCLHEGVPISVCEAKNVGKKQIDDCECISAFSYFTESNTGDISKCIHYSIHGCVNVSSADITI